MSNSFWRHGLQHRSLPWPSLSPGVCSNSCPLSPWCYPTISSSVAPFSFSISPSNEYSGLISFKIDWFDYLDVQGTLKSLFQHHSWKASIFWCSAFFTVQLSQLYMTTGKTIALTIWIFVSRVLSLLFKTMSRFVIPFLPRSSRLISWLQSPFTVILEPKKRKSVTTFTFSPSICHEVIGPDAMILGFF